MIIVNIKLLGAEQGYHTTLNATDTKFEPIDGFLSPLPPELKSSLKNWQLTYRNLNDVRSCFSRLNPKGVIRCSAPGETQTVKAHLNEWLNSGDSMWRPIRDSLISIANQNHTNQEIHLLLDIQDIELSHFPWQEWNIFEEHYPEAEVILRVRGQAGNRISPPQSCSKIRILVVVGRSDGINTQSDLKVIEKLEEKGAEVISLIKPTFQELCEALWDKQGYHIFIFTGHSRSQEGGQIGWIDLNNQEELSIGDFKNALKRAIDNGLQLAIFNSCDGLGLAYQLAQLNLPRSIVMREPVPDLVAVDFLKYLFEEFTSNKSLFTSVHIARKRLEYFKLRYPGATWLPLMCIRQSALDKPFTWQGLCEKSNSEPLIESNPIQRIGKAKLIVVVSVLGLVVLSISIWLFESKLNINDQRSIAPSSCPIKSIPSQQNATEKHITYFRCFADVPNVPSSKTWKRGGSTTWAVFRPEIDKKLKQIFGINLETPNSENQAPASGIGIQMLIEGQLNFAESSERINETQRQEAAKRGFKLEEEAVAIDAIAIIVHPNLNIEGLTINQLRDIYTGNITNWSEVDGPDIPITKYSRSLNSGTTKTFLNDYLGSKKLAENVVLVEDTTEALRKVAKNEGAIYFASAPEVVTHCGVKPIPIFNDKKGTFVAPYKVPLVPHENCPKQRNEINIEAFKNGDYPITRPLFVIIKQDGKDNEEAGKTYARLLLSDEGQELIKKVHWVPIR